MRGDSQATTNQLTTTYAPLIDDLAVGNMVMLADGTIALHIEEKNADWARCRVVGGGIIRSRQGINLPGAKLSVASLTEADMTNAIWAAKNEVDFVSLSFVRKAVDVSLLKEMLRSQGSAARSSPKSKSPRPWINFRRCVRPMG